MKTQLLTALVTLSLLTACGGGGGDNSPQTDKPQVPGGNASGKTYFMPDTATEPDNDDAWRDFSGYTLARNGSAFVNGVFGKGDTVNTASVPSGFAEFPAQMTMNSKNGRGTTENVTVRSYQGFHSGVFAINPPSGGVLSRLGVAESGLPYFNPTQNLPSAGKATYTGRAFDTNAAHDATLRYTIDFGARRGSGEISASRGLGRMTLHDAPITRFTANDSEFGTMPAYGIKGSRTLDGSKASGSYALGIAGPNAEEIVGWADIDDDYELSLHGTRGEISK
jgi:lipoprotein GNA1870